MHEVNLSGSAVGVGVGVGVRSKGVVCVSQRC